MRSDAEIAAEIFRRVDLIKAGKARKRRRIRFAEAAVFCFLLAGIFAVAVMSGGVGQSLTSGQAQASVVMMGGAAVGGYVLVGVTAFALGCAVTVISLRMVKRNKFKELKNDKNFSERKG